MKKDNSVNTRSNKFWKFVLILFFSSLTFFPIIPIGSISVPSSVIFFPIFLFKNQLQINKKIIYLSLFSVLWLLFLYIPNLLLNNNIVTKDILFAFLPIYFCFLYHFAVNAIETDSDKRTVQKMLKFFLIVQTIFCVLQLTNLFNSNVLLEKIYFFWPSPAACRFLVP